MQNRIRQRTIGAIFSYILRTLFQTLLFFRNPQTERFSNSIKIGSSSSKRAVRSWISVDGKIRGKRFRFVTTHLESFHLGVQAVQASELLQGPCNTELPVILAGDLNTESASGNPVDNTAYQIILGSGFVDAWILLHPEDPGLTWPLHGEDPFTAFSTPSQRIDLVLFRGELRSLKAKLIGQTPAALTSSGLWPSDHAGVIARFKLKP